MASETYQARLDGDSAAYLDELKERHGYDSKSKALKKAVEEAKRSEEERAYLLHFATLMLGAAIVVGVIGLITPLLSAADTAVATGTFVVFGVLAARAGVSERSIREALA